MQIQIYYLHTNRQKLLLAGWMAGCCCSGVEMMLKWSAICTCEVNGGKHERRIIRTYCIIFIFNFQHINLGSAECLLLCWGIRCVGRRSGWLWNMRVVSARRNVNMFSLLLFIYCPNYVPIFDFLFLWLPMQTPTNHAHQMWIYNDVLMIKDCKNQQKICFLQAILMTKQESRYSKDTHSKFEQNINSKLLQFTYSNV